MLSEGLLMTRNVSKSFGGVVALKNVSVSVRPQTLTLVIGPNGSGKTTLINVIGGILQPDEGHVYFSGLDITKLSPHERFRLGLARTFQTPQLFTSLSVLENVLVPDRSYYEERVIEILLNNVWRIKEKEYVEKAFSILRLLNLDRLWDASARELSGGQMKLLELARVLMSDPKLVILDEPLAGVNPSLANEIMGYLTKLRSGLGTTFLIIEHRLDIALKYVDHVIAMHQGQVIAEGLPDEIVKHPAVVEAYLGG
ncbi:MAG: ABC transporter ATP-binding protein [Infirmifilum sp.]|jgi:branched-chain amino acid transport system ATP-binding protein|uniref:Probable branched-chain amino acid transport ATP-binding protein LivG n=1 Tax=Infirmifilum uzonense TaxID=1550241 RepID=A0A0F7FK09_9CREN|nr:ABC transporter ATP-binding protein [Infirmifilum uzonense]AKG39415.1 branched-chain amino acid ABC transporter substrate-binding protein [Infirmifilum uzonense]